MFPIIPLLFAAALGFGIGYKLKDCLCKNEKPSNIPNIRNLANDTSDTFDNVPKENSAFSLHSIDNVFNQYNVPLTSDYSFSRLLDTIERQSYINLLKHIDLNITSPDDLFRFLNNENLNVSKFDIGKASGKPYLTQEYANAILEGNGVDHSHLNTLDEKVEFLLILAQGKGTKRFQKSFGDRLTTFINSYKTGEDVKAIYESIKNIIHDRLEFFS